MTEVMASHRSLASGVTVLASLMNALLSGVDSLEQVTNNATIPATHHAVCHFAARFAWIFIV